jgi:dihydrofolate synthase/folylpolyglutamate synthase
MEASLERIKAVLSKLGNPERDLKAIHIAGTNGKGSVSAMLSCIFKNAGYKTGLFISPFIIDFRERIQINSEYISENNLVCYAEKVKETNIVLTEFEFITALAFLYFKEQKIDILICETGLGGRFDATNTLDNLVAAVITKIGLDHTAILGDTIEKIAYEKCGILRDCPVITSYHQDEKALEVIKMQANKLYIPDKNALKVTNNQNLGNTFIYKGKEYELSLCGDYQVENALVVLETIENCGVEIPYNVIYVSLKETKFPARMEIVREKPLVIIDGAHNPDGAFVLANEIKKFSGEVVAIIGMMKDKDFEEVLKTTLPYVKKAIAVEVKNMPRSLKANELKSVAEKYCKCDMAESYEKAIEMARDNPIFIFGSLYLAADMRKFFKKD